MQTFSTTPSKYHFIRSGKFTALAAAIVEAQTGSGDEFLKLTDEYTRRRSDGSYLVTPNEWVEGLNRLLSNSVVLSLSGEGLTGQGQGSSCIDEQIYDYYIYNLQPKDLMREGTR